MGLIYGEYAGRSDEFQPGGVSYECGFVPHGVAYEEVSALRPGSFNKTAR
jgi:homogentisate 1,2-dioxygenase